MKQRPMILALCAALLAIGCASKKDPETAPVGETADPVGETADPVSELPD